MLIDLSGYSFSGKSALYDILDSMINAGGFGLENEFDLIRVNGGLYELASAISGSPWSPVRSDGAIREFRNLAWNLGGSRSKLKDRIFRLGTYYDDLFPGFSDEAEVFIQKLISTSWKGSWPFPIYRSSFWEIALEKCASKVGYVRHDNIFLSRGEPNEVCELCNSFVTSLVSSACKKLNVEHLILSNSFEPSANDAMYSLVEGCCPIIVDRDPRDIYVSAWLNSFGNREVGSVALGGNVDQFIKRFKIFRGATSQASKAVHVRFEIMLTDFDYLYSKLSRLDLDKDDLYKCWRRVSSLSSRNIGVWRQKLPQNIEDDLGVISDQLSSYFKN